MPSKRKLDNRSNPSWKPWLAVGFNGGSLNANRPELELQKNAGEESFLEPTVVETHPPGQLDHAWYWEPQSLSNWNPVQRPRSGKEEGVIPTSVSIFPRSPTFVHLWMHSASENADVTGGPTRIASASPAGDIRLDCDFLTGRGDTAARLYCLS
jgi:hypothetical protein